MSRFLKVASQRTLKLSNALITSSAKCSSNASNTNFLQYDKDPGSKFIDPSTQTLLKSLTRLQLDKVFKKRTVPNNKVEYKFMTTEQIEAEVRASMQKAEALLQMAPIVKIQEDRHKLIDKEPGMTSFDECMHIITDITYGIKDTNRTIVVRHPDGTLENANADIRKRMNQIYFPLQGRRIRPPRMFEDVHLQRCLDEFKYEFILDRLCIQFEPYEMEFHRISSQVFLHINESRQFDCLRSTRHFGSLSFFLAWHKLIDDLLIDMIKRDYLKNGVELICLMLKLNDLPFDQTILTQLNQLNSGEQISKRILNVSNSGELQQDIENSIGKTADDFKSDEIALNFIEEFTKTRAVKKSQIEICLQSYRETNDEKRRILEGLQKAHGVS